MDKYKCYLLMNFAEMSYYIVTPAHPVGYPLVDQVIEIELKPYTLLDRIILAPAVACAMLARLVRKVTNKKGTSLERSLMRFYYLAEVSLRGY